MSKADDMFKELGYGKFENGNFIQFNKIKELIAIEFLGDKKEIVKTKGYDKHMTINMQELKAINEKVKELGWLDEEFRNYILGFMYIYNKKLLKMFYN